MKTKAMTQRKAAEAEIRERFECLRDSLTERGRRLFAGSEALAFGYGGITATSRATSLSPRTVRRGLAECQEIELGVVPPLAPHRSRRPGGGRRKLTQKHPRLLPTLKELLESTTRGDPESPLLWTARSQRNLVAAMKEKGYSLSKHTLAKLLQDLGYSLQGNNKRLEGAQHPDRNAQFEHINETVRRQLEVEEPAISIDTKKKELVGAYKNTGQELRPKGQPEPVNVHDFPDDEMGKVVPYGVYDLAENEAWVSVGISHDTAQFAVETIRTWYEQPGQSLYPRASSLLIMADSGGSNGYRLRLWKVHSRRWLTTSDSPSLCATCHQAPANGTR